MQNECIEHIKHIFEEAELDEKSVVRNFRTVQIEEKNKICLRKCQLNYLLSLISDIIIVYRGKYEKDSFC